jgi:3-deoxy-7-phosphoheptulonate synthase
MMIVMKPTATEEEIQAVIDRIQGVGARAHPSRGEEVTVIGAIGDREHVARLELEGSPGVERVVPILKP